MLREACIKQELVTAEDTRKYTQRSVEENGKDIGTDPPSVALKVYAPLLYSYGVLPPNPLPSQVESERTRLMGEENFRAWVVEVLSPPTVGRMMGEHIIVACSLAGVDGEMGRSARDGILKNFKEREGEGGDATILGKIMATWEMDEGWEKDRQGEWSGIVGKGWKIAKVLREIDTDS